MRKLIDYVVLYQDDADELRNEILTFISDGYELHGSLCVSYNPEKDIEGDWMYQAVVKYE